MKRGPQAANRNNAPRPARGRSTQFGLLELAPGKHPNVDIVAIHGIDGHIEFSWTADNGTLWLRDLLPDEIPNARILTYGYDANTHGQEQLSTNYMHDHAVNLVSKLALFRERTSTTKRPIIFVAYSSGGILLKSALVYSHLTHDGHLKHHHAISQSTHGIAFFATPHQGSAVAELARSLLIIESPFIRICDTLLRHLERDSEALQHQLLHYSAISEQYETKFFYEMYDMEVAGRMCKVVPKSSAVVPGAVNAESIGLNKNHFDMVKFSSPDDEDFLTVATTLLVMSKAAPQRIYDKWEATGVTATVTDILLTSSQREALSNIPRVTSARFDADSRPRCLEGTRVELLKTTSTWTDQDSSPEHRRIFWLCGQAGTGKTTISLTVAGNCQKNGRLGASFFFSRDHTERSDLRLVFPTLAQQLGVFHRPFQVLLARALEQDPDIVHLDPMYQLKKLIIEPLISCDSFPSSTVIVIDALDECKDDNPISKILSLLSANIYEASRLKFFVTSRPENHILCGFRPLIANTQSIILHEIEGSIVDHDIELYLRAKLSIASTLYPGLPQSDWPPDEAIKSLVVKSGRLFIFATTAMHFILDDTYSDPLNQLDILLGHTATTHSSSSSPFSFLDQLYLQVLHHAFPSKTTPDRLTLLRMIFGAIILLCDPLSPGALESLLGLRRGIVRTTLRHLHSVIVVPSTDEQPIRLIHPSLFDFAMSRCLDADFRIDSSMCHEQLAISCFKQMNGLKRNICEIEDASKLNREIEDLAERIQRCIPHAMQYACQHWPSHLCATGENIPLQGLLKEFCHKQLLYWIEVLSLLGCLREGIHDLKQVLKFLRASSPPPEDLLVIITDNVQFMIDYFEPISCASLQLYRSALPLSVPSSLLSKTFRHEFNGGILLLPGRREKNSSGVTIFRGSQGAITSVAFSQDGSTIVSASGDEVRLWDCGTGTLLKELKTEWKSTVRWARFFPDGSRVISGTSKYTIWIWNVTTGTCLQTIQLRGINVDADSPSYTCSPDFKRIVGSKDNNINIWDTSTGDLLNTLIHCLTVRAVAFSPNHIFIASASNDHNICIWDAISGALLRTIRTHSLCVYTIAFSPDSKHITYGSSAKTICLLDASSTVTLQTFVGHTNSVCSVAISPDGARVISGSDDNTLKVWNVADGKLLQTIRVPGWVRNVGFSPNGTQYISATGDAIYLWNADQVSCWIAEDEWLSPNDVKFSFDGAHFITLASGVLHVWDSRTRDIVISQTSVVSAAFSPNNKHIAFEFDHKISLWDLASRTTLWQWIKPSHDEPFSLPNTRIHNNWGSNITFSADGSQLTVGPEIPVDFDTIPSGVLAPGGYPRPSRLNYGIPLHFRLHAPPAMEQISEQAEYLMEAGWIFASRGSKKQRCVWIGVGAGKHSSRSGRYAVWTRHGLVLLDSSSIDLSI